MSGPNQKPAGSGAAGCGGTVVAAVLYLASLPLPAFAGDGSTPMVGWQCLVFGLLYTPWLLVMLCPAWFANPALLVAAVSLANGRGRRAVRWGVAAIVLGVTSLMFGGPGPAFFLWTASMAVVVVTGAAIGDPPPWSPPTRDEPDEGW